MRWFDKRYHTLDHEMKTTFGRKVAKLSLDGGFTCPNRDGTLGSRGCIFCSEVGSGEFAGSRNLGIREQIEEQKRLLSHKWPGAKYIAYFQNFTNTYGSIEKLERLYREALSCPDVVGLAIATRPDCLPAETVELLADLSKATYLWVELGLQTIHPKSAVFIRRGYDLECFEAAVENLKEKRIRTAVHLIFGLPGESREEMLESADYVAGIGVWGVKIHLLHVLMDTDLHRYYLKNPFPLMSREEYTGVVCDAIEILPPDMVVHRLTGDGKKDRLVGPWWSLDKLRVLSGIDQELKKRDSFQGIKYRER